MKLRNSLNLMFTNGMHDNPSKSTTDLSCLNYNPTLVLLTDTQAPSLMCPASRTFYAERNTLYAVVSWTFPQVIN